MYIYNWTMLHYIIEIMQYTGKKYPGNAAGILFVGENTE